MSVKLKSSKIIFSAQGPRSKTTSAESTHPYRRGRTPSTIKTLNTISSGCRGGRLEGGGLRLAECDGVGEVLLLLQPQPPHAVVLGPPRRLGCHLQVDLEMYKSSFYIKGPFLSILVFIPRSTKLCGRHRILNCPRQCSKGVEASVYP